MAHTIFKETNCILGHKVNLYKSQKTEIIQNFFSDSNVIK